MRIAAQHCHGNSENHFAAQCSDIGVHHQYVFCVQPTRPPPPRTSKPFPTEARYFILTCKTNDAVFDDTFTVNIELIVQMLSLFTKPDDVTQCFMQSARFRGCGLTSDPLWCEVEEGCHQCAVMVISIPLLPPSGC